MYPLKLYITNFNEQNPFNPLPNLNLIRNTLHNMPSSAKTEKPISEARTAVVASLNATGTSLEGELKTRARDLHANSSVIADQEKELAKQTALLAKQGEQWQKLADCSTKKLNEFGDIQNWAEMIERDLMVVEETLHLVSEGGRQSGSRNPNNG